MMFRAATIAAALLAGTSTAQAEGYSISDLGTVYSHADCMARAERILRRYRDNFGGGKLDPSNWAVYAWDLRPGDQDVVITCTSASDSGASTRRALIIVYGERSASERKATREILKGYWRD